MLDFCAGIYDGFNKNKCVGGIFVDITKAFDAVDHELLLSVLWNAGFRGCSWLWFKSYLFNRSQCVKVKDNFSSLKTISCGVPQGSVMGPILFLVFINSLCCGPFKGSLTCFADDTALCYNSDSIISLKLDMQYDLDLLKMWFTFNKLTLSNKTKYMFFSLSNKTYFIEDLYFKCVSCLSVGINHTCNKCLKIERVNSIKYLGLYIDSKCTWEEHLKNIEKYMLSSLRTFYLLRDICPVRILRMVYFSIINSKLQYGICCWGVLIYLD